MAIFRYRALSVEGKKLKGLINADSYLLAKEKLYKESILVTHLEAISKHKEVVLSPGRLLAFTRELGQLLQAGLPLYESVVTIEEKFRHHRCHPLFLDLCDRLKEGHLLSQILKRHPKSFDQIYIAMVQTGERTGDLAWIFQELHLLIEKKQKLKKRLVSALSYPLFLGVFCFVVIIALLLFVIPSMEELFEGRALHPLTQTVLWMSHFLQHFFIPLLFSFLSCVIGLIFFSKQKKGALFFQKLWHRIPLIKTITTQAALIRFCRSAAVLLQGTIPLVQSLEIARGVMKHPMLEEAILRAEKRVVEGKFLSEELRKEPLVPPLVSRMIAMAEETGKLADSLRSIADIYDDELERNLTQVTTFLQPILLLILGGIVGLVILSILLPLTDVGSLIGS